MLTVYGVTLIVQKPKNSAAEIALRETVGQVVEPWLEQTWPNDKRTNTTQVTARSNVNDKVFRVDISEQHPADDARQVTLISMFNNPRGDLCVDVRREVRPTGQLILPRTRTERPLPALTSLVSNLARELRVRDAQQLISANLSRASTHDEGAAIAAFIEAPSRRLPLIIECTSTKGANATTTADTARVLTGIAHVHHLTTTEAEAGFNDFYGTRKVSSSWILVAWPRTVRGTVLSEHHGKDDEQVVNDLIAAAVGALPMLPRQTTRSQSPSQVPIQQVVASTSSPEVGELRRKNQELEQRVTEVQSDYDELYENLTTTEHLSAKIAEDRDRYLHSLTDFLSLRDDPSQWNNTAAVLSRAKGMCSNLDFHPEVETRLGKLQFSPATNQRILGNLVELNNLAARLRRGDIEPHLFNTYCTEKFNFAPSVSDNAINKFGSDYTIIWNDAAVQLGPHIRCNEARIYFYLDVKQRRVVIGHVGEHLRDKGNQ